VLSRSACRRAPSRGQWGGGHTSERAEPELLVTPSPACQWANPSPPGPPADPGPHPGQSDYESGSAWGPARRPGFAGGHEPGGPGAHRMLRQASGPLRARFKFKLPQREKKKEENLNSRTFAGFIRWQCRHGPTLSRTPRVRVTVRVERSSERRQCPSPRRTGKLRVGWKAPA
jgi:hypothetical protein